MLAIPAILHENKDSWEWDGWKPKAKPDAPQEVKDAIAEFISEADAEEDGDGSLVFT